jgi:hypothetical protein
MRPAKLIRAIEWEVVPRDMAGSIGLTPTDVKTHFKDEDDLAVVKCVCVDDETGEKFTCVTDAQQFKGLVESGEAGDPAGMTLSRSTWPVVFRGWLQTG